MAKKPASTPSARAGASSVEGLLDALRAIRAEAESTSGRADFAFKLRPFVQHANNLVVARAADLVRELDLRSLVPELAAAMRGFLDKPPKADPQCWAKSALAKALHHLGCEDSSLFLAGLRLHQYEPTWGGQSDVAGPVRSNCAHALIDCHELTHHVTLLHLLELVADPDMAVRAEAWRAIAQAGGESAVLLLRLRALTPGSDEDPRIIGQCFAGLLSLESTAAVPFVAGFLRIGDEIGAEAALALGETRSPDALEALLQCLHRARNGPPKDQMPGERKPRAARFEPAFTSALLSGIALTRQPKAIDTLLDLVASRSGYEETAIEALATAGFGPDVQRRLECIVNNLESERISRSYKSHFSA